MRQACKRVIFIETGVTLKLYRLYSRFVATWVQIPIYCSHFEYSLLIRFIFVCTFMIRKLNRHYMELLINYCLRIRTDYSDARCSREKACSLSRRNFIIASSLLHNNLEQGLDFSFQLKAPCFHIFSVPMQF